MLTCNAFSKTIRYPIVPPVQKLLFLVRFSASSSDSSDSDSDTENKRKEKKLSDDVKKSQSEESNPSMHLKTLLEELKKVDKKSSRPVSIVMKPKQKAEKVSKSDSSASYEKKLHNAAEDVAISLGGDTERTKSDLISKMTSPNIKKSETVDKQESQETPLKPTIDLNALISSMKVVNLEGKETNKFYEAKIAKVRTLTAPNPKSVLRDLLLQQKQREVGNGDLVINRNYLRTGKPLGIFNEMQSTTTLPELNTWQTLEEKHLKLLITHPPQNIFQELIQWTEQGKLWRFPIDNEQGLEEEQNVHFSEHVFLERHLKDWCPKKGPIRHFMELVCVGLSKNPYITVQEKLEHIRWYQEYFESKRDVLERIGAVESTNVETKQIES